MLEPLIPRYARVSDAPPDVRLRIIEARLEALESAVQVRGIPWSKVVPICLTLILTAGGVIWRLAQYPSRDEVDAAERRWTAEVTELRRTVGDLEREQIRARLSLDAMIEANKTLTDKLDRALAAPVRRR